MLTDTREWVWIFQSIPAKYDLDHALRVRDHDVWLVRQYRQQIRSGQRVYFWIAGQSGGLAAEGVTTDDPLEIPAPGWQLPAWQPSERSSASIPELRVPVRFTRKIFGRRWRRADLLCQAALREQRPIAPTHVGTNFAVSSEADAALQSLLVTSFGAGEP